MEASRFGFGNDTSSGYKFDPTDADVVAFYLLPRALGLHHPHHHAIIHDDPASLPPWELLDKHGHADSDHAFFFSTVANKTRNGGRKERAIKDGRGTWRGQKGTEEVLTLLGPDGAELDIKYKRYNLTYYRARERGTTGWVMHEYEIISPPLLHVVLSRIRVTDRGKTLVMQWQQAKAEALAAYANQQAFPDHEQPGLSHQYHAGNAVVMGNDDAFPDHEQPGLSHLYHAGNAVVMGNCDGFSHTQNDVFHGDNGGGIEETGGQYTSLHYAAEGGGYNSYYIAGGGDDNMYQDDADGVKYKPDDGQEFGH